MPDHVSTALTTPALVRWRTDVLVNVGESFPSTKRVVCCVCCGGFVVAVTGRDGWVVELDLIGTVVLVVVVVVEVVLVVDGSVVVVEVVVVRPDLRVA